jgi:hypothetical protein
MELKKAYELESSLKVTLVVRDEQVTETEEEEGDEDSDYHIESRNQLEKGLEIQNPQIQR